MTCNAPDLQARFTAEGVIGLDGSKYYPRDGKIFLEAVYDHYFFKMERRSDPCAGQSKDRRRRKRSRVVV